MGRAALTTNYVSSDTNGISLIEGDPRLIVPPTPLDLNGVTLQFTPSGSGYTITNAAGTFDTNLGTKLDMTAPPAVNPRIGVDAEDGDDAYILQDLGFNFSFFGSSYSTVAVSSNGNLTFRPAGLSDEFFNLSTVSSFETFTEFEQGLPRIAPYWHNLQATAGATTGAMGIYIRRDPDRVLITWNDIRDYPFPDDADGVHRFQASLFNDGRIVFTYATAQLTSKALAGITPGLTANFTTVVDLSNPAADAIAGPAGQFFSLNAMVDYIEVIRAFYATHPEQTEDFDFLYMLTNFDFDLDGAFASYLPIRNDAQGIGLSVFDDDPEGTLGSLKIQGFLNLGNIASSAYRDFPTTRSMGANHALSIWGQEQGHRWLAHTSYPGDDPNLLLGRDFEHWSFFFNTESTISTPGTRRSSSSEGNVWQDNGNGTFTSINLIDGYSRLDQYLMGLRPANEVPDTFVITNPSNTNPSDPERTSASNPSPNVTITGTRQNISIGEIVQANGSRIPDSTISQKRFRAAIVLLVQAGTQPSAQTLSKVNRYRLAWESYFAQSTDHLARISTSLTDPMPHTISLASAASYSRALAGAELAVLFGQGGGLTDGRTESASSQPWPTTLAGIQVRVDGTPAQLAYASPSQINFQVPRMTTSVTPNLSVPSATALVEVVRSNQVIRVGTFPIAPTTPAIFTFSGTGSGQAKAADAITNALPPFNAKRANGQPNVIAVQGTGLGPDATDSGGDVSASTQALIDGVPVPLFYAGPAPGFTGVNQFNIGFPPDITSGEHTLVISRHGVPSNVTTIRVK